MDKKKPIGYSKKDTSEMKALIERTQEKAGDYVGSGTVTTVPKKKKKMKRMQMGGKVMNPALAASTQPTSPRGMGTNDGGPTPSSTGSLGAVKTPVRGTGTNDGGPAPSSTGSLGAVKTPVRGPAMPNGGMGGPGKPMTGLSPSQSLPSGAVKGPGGIRLEGRPGPVRGPAMPNGGMGGPVKTGPTPDYTTMPIRGPGGRVRGGGGVPVQGPGGVVVPPMSPDSKGPRGMMRGRFMDKLGMKRTMKGGGLARKGVGMALAKGGLVKANGCAQRGKSKGKMV
jgi:hypothetical protein